MCGVNFDHELGETVVKVFSSVKELKGDAKCWPDCGIVKVKVYLGKWVKKPVQFSKQKTIPASQVDKLLLKETRAEIKRLKKYEADLVKAVKKRK